MQSTRLQTGQSAKLFHVQNQTYIELPPNLFVIHLGKLNDKIPPDIDLSNFPNSDVVSRVHADIHVEKNNYFIEDVGSSNGTYINQTLLTPLTRYSLKTGDRIDFGKENSLTFIFQVSNGSNISNHSSTKNTSSGLPAATNRLKDEEEANIALFTKLLGLGLMLGGLGFLCSSIVIGSFGVLPAIPAVVGGIAGVLTLQNGGIFRNLGWVWIAIGVAVTLLLGGVVIVPMTFLSFLLASGSFSAGYQLFTAGKVLDIDWFMLKKLIKKNKR